MKQTQSIAMTLKRLLKLNDPNSFLSADMLSNKRLHPIGTELFIKGGKLNIFLVFITQSHFALLTKMLG